MSPLLQSQLHASSSRHQCHNLSRQGKADLRKGHGDGAFGQWPGCWDRTPPNPVSEASTSIKNRPHIRIWYLEDGLLRWTWIPGSGSPLRLQESTWKGSWRRWGQWAWKPPHCNSWWTSDRCWRTTGYLHQKTQFSTSSLTHRVLHISTSVYHSFIWKYLQKTTTKRL